MSSLVGAALFYASLGWKVIPLHNIENGQCTCGKPDCNGSSGKHPRLKNWPEEATTDPMKIIGWWNTWPNANVGVTGQFIVDIDGPQGEESLKNREWPRTPTAKTGKGKHYHFKWPAVDFPIKNDVSILPGVDIRVAKGQAVMPPSMHYTGIRYEWEIDPSACELAELPTWFIDILREKRGKPEAIAPVPKTSDPYAAAQKWAETDDRYKKYAEAALRDEAIKLMNAPEGERNDTLNDAAFSLGQLVGARVLDELDVERTLKRAARASGLTESEIEKTLASGLAAGMKKPRKLPDGELPGIKRRSIPTFVLGDYSLTDIGNSERLVNLFGEDMRYCQTWKKWIVWDGKRWQIDDSNVAKIKGIETSKTIFNEAAEATSKEKIREIGSWALISASRGKIEAMLDLAKGYLAISPTDLDQDVWLLNCQNGTLDLRSGNLQDHCKEDFITKILDVDYDEEATAPVWKSFIQKIFDQDQELIRFIQKAAGYTLTATIKEQIWFLLYGTGQNGKSTFINALLFVLGSYGITAKFDTFQVQRSEGVRNDLADMKGCRIVAAIEAKQGKRLDETVLKQLTGEDKIRARHLYAEFEEFTPTHKLWLIANHKPTVHETTKAFWRRVRLIPFLVTIPDSEVDKDLNQKLESEKEGILAWLVEGCRLWQKEGLNPPVKVLEATAEYREEMDILAGFLDDLCELTFDWNDRVQSATLYEHYVIWCKGQREKEGEEVVPINRKLFGMKLTERGLKREKTGGNHYWLGLKFKVNSSSEQAHPPVQPITKEAHKPINSHNSNDIIQEKECESKGPMGLNQDAEPKQDGPDSPNGQPSKSDHKTNMKIYDGIVHLLKKSPRKDKDRLGLTLNDLVNETRLTPGELAPWLEEREWKREASGVAEIEIWWAPEKALKTMGFR